MTGTKEHAMELIFHIGTEKAGSTALQMWLTENVAELREAGIFYCESLGRPNNLGIYLYGLGGGTDEGFGIMGAISDNEKSELVARFKQDLSNEVAAAKEAGARMFVISNEHCHSRLNSLDSISRVHELLFPLFDKMTLWCFLRPQIDMCLSFVSTLAVNGIKVTPQLFETLMQEEQYYFNYHKVLTNWASIFGKDNLVPISFKRNNDTAICFMALLSLNPDRFSKSKRVNSAIDYRSVGVSGAMGIPFYLPDGRINPNSSFFISMLPVQEKLNLDREFAMRLQRNFTFSNAVLTATWPKIKREDLEPSPTAYPVTGNLHKLNNAEALGGHFRFIVERFNALLWIEKSEKMMAMSEIETLRGNPGKAVSFCEKALSHANHARDVESARSLADSRIRLLEKKLSELRAEPT